jgi:hypothetical protein
VVDFKFEPPLPSYVVIGRHRYLSCLCEARSPGSKYGADR